MSLNPNTAPTSFATALIEAARAKYSYSRKRRDAFGTWQEHVRRSAGLIGSASLGSQRDRDLRRVVVAE